MTAAAALDDNPWLLPPVRVPGARLDGPPPPWTDDRRIALHEAGHAVCALALGMRVQSAAFVEGHPDMRAEVLLLNKRPDLLLAYQMAGAAGEFIAWGAAGPGWCAGPLCDLKNALDTAAEIVVAGTGRKATPAEVRQLVEAAQRDAETIVGEWWESVLAVADRLLVRRRLLGAEVEAIARDHAPLEAAPAA